jgi:Zn-dependent protease
MKSLTSSSIPVGRLFGIPMRLHITFLIFLWLQLRANEDPGVGVLMVLGITASIVLHELGHALAARQYGGWPDEIVLWQFGGVAVCREPGTRQGMLAVTLGGPLVTLLLASALTGISLWTESLPPTAVKFTPALPIAALARFNWIALAFNLIPAFPMDGGRLLRDLLAFRMGTFRASAFAEQISRCIAVAALALGLLLPNSDLVTLSLFLFLTVGWQFFRRSAAA